MTTEAFASQLFIGSVTRATRICANDDVCSKVVPRMIEIAAGGLPLMYDSNRRQFAFTRRLVGRAIAERQGISVRYGAIVLLGVQFLDLAGQRQVLGGETAAEFCARLITLIRNAHNIGDVALIAWAAAELRLDDASCPLQQLRRLLSVAGDCDTVAAAWALSAFTAAADMEDTRAEAEAARQRLMRAYRADAGLFSHWTNSSAAPRWRAHVGCFADQVYPIQALARFHKAFDIPSALETANRCAAQICRLQGPGGQWWWHYDVRTGEVIEGYPVYSVHQDAMAPMALLDLFEAGGTDYAEAIRRGLKWMECAPEVGRSLIDEYQMLIWRKVARFEPRKFTRCVRTALTALSPSLRAHWLDTVLCPSLIDYESRPYHLGWVLHAWLGGLK